MRYGPVLPLLALIVPHPAIAEDAGAEGAAVTHPTIIVTGEALPLPPGTPAYGSQIIGRVQLVAASPGGIESVLDDVAGFQEYRRSDSRSANPSAQGVTLRALGGNASSRTLVLLDGVPVADPFFGSIPFTALAPERLSAIRVTRGSGAGAFGAGALAGAIELLSASRADLPGYGFSGFYGSKQASSLSGETTQDLGGGYVSVSGRWDRGDGFDTTPASQRVAATVPAAYDSWSTNLRAVAPLSANAELQVHALVFRDTGVLRFAGANYASQGQDASVRLLVKGPWQLDALAYVQARNFSNVVVSSTTFLETLNQRNTPSTGLGGKVELRPPVGTAHVLRIGTDTRFTGGDMWEDAYASTGVVTARRHAAGKQNVTGLFIEDDWTPQAMDSRLVLTAGARVDHWSIDGGYLETRNTAGNLTAQSFYPDRYGWRATARAGLIWHVSDIVALRSAAYTGFRLPTPNELYRSYTVFPVTTQANATLGLESLKGAEAGLELKPATGISLSATAFYNRLGNAIANVTIGTNLQQRQNVPAIVARGVELAASARLGHVDLLASYAYSHATVDAPGLPSNGLVPAQSPRHAASGTATWTPGRPAGASVSATVRYVSRQYEDDLATYALNGAVTMDASLRLPVRKGVTLILRGENLTDTAVMTRNAAGSIDFGTRRTLWVGVRIEH